MKMFPDRWMSGARRLTGFRLAIAAAGSLALAAGLIACESVAGYSQQSLVRVIDASYIAPAVNFYVEGTLFASNIGEGTVTGYGTMTPSGEAAVKVTDVTGSPTLVQTNATLGAGQQHSIFLTDNGAAPTEFTVTVLEDQQAAARTGQSAFRFLNQAPKTGAIDVYMVPSGVTLANSIPLVTGLPVGATAGYISFTSQTVTMVITPTGVTKPKYTSTPFALTGGEVRTVVVVDSQLTSNPPVQVVVADDVD
jgi:hypothetical protein